jgi:hypothetical protein
VVVPSLQHLGDEALDPAAAPGDARVEDDEARPFELLLPAAGCDSVCHADSSRLIRVAMYLPMGQRRQTLG